MMADDEGNDTGRFRRLIIVRRGLLGGSTPGLLAPAAPTLTWVTGPTDNTPQLVLDGDLAELDTVREQHSTDSGFAGSSESTNTVDAVEDAANELDFTGVGALADGTWYVRMRIERPGHANSAWSNTETKTIDTTPPTLSSPTGTKTGETTASLSVSTNEANGTVYWVVDTNTTTPSAAQVKLGKDQGGNAADDSGSQAVIATGVQTISGGADGLTGSTTYKSYYMHEDAVGNQSTVSASASFTTDSGSYAGPGDVVGSATVWRGVRAYNAAYATGSNPALDLHKDSDGTFSATINILANGSLDVATAATVIAGGASKVGRLYDQVATKHATQAILALMPTLTLNVYGSIPAIVFAGAQILTAPTYAGQINEPYTFSTVGERTGATSSYGTLIGDTNITPQIGFDASADHMFMYNGSVVTFAAVDNDPHAMQAVFNGASSSAYIDGSDSGSVNPGTGALLVTGSETIGGGNNPLTGRFVEGGTWPTGFDGTQKSNMNGNQHSYYGF